MKMKIDTIEKCKEELERYAKYSKWHTRFIIYDGDAEGPKRALNFSGIKNYLCYSSRVCGDEIRICAHPTSLMNTSTPVVYKVVQGKVRQPKIANPVPTNVCCLAERAQKSVDEGAITCGQ